MKRLAFLVVLGVTTAACGAAPAAQPSATAPAASATARATASPTARPVSLKVNWSAASGASSGLWTAVEAGYFKEESLDVELANVPSSSRAMAALLSKEVQFTHLDGQVLVDANLTGANVRMIYGITNRLVFSVMTKADIKKPEDLKGKKLGITSFGSSTHTASLLAFRMWNLQADRDVALVPLVEVPNILAAMIAGQVDAGTVSPPTNTRAKASGFSELVNLAKDGPEWPSVGVAATRDYLQANPDVPARFVRAYARGVQRFKSDKAFGIKALQKYLRLDDQAVLEDTWQQYSIYLAELPHVLGMQNVLDIMGATNAKAKTLKMEDLIDARYVKQLEDEGFFKKLYGK